MVTRFLPTIIIIILCVFRLLIILYIDICIVHVSINVYNFQKTQKHE